MISLYTMWLYSCATVSDGDGPEAVEAVLQELERRWKDISLLLQETHSKILLNMDSNKFYGELAGLQDVMMSYEKWVHTAEKIAEEATEITRQLEQCKVSDGSDE